MEVRRDWKIAYQTPQIEIFFSIYVSSKSSSSKKLPNQQANSNEFKINLKAIKIIINPKTPPQD